MYVIVIIKICLALSREVFEFETLNSNYTTLKTGLFIRYLTVYNVSKHLVADNIWLLTTHGCYGSNCLSLFI